MFCFSVLDTDQDSGSSAGTWTTLNFGNDVSSWLQSNIDRPTTSKFRVLKTGYYKITYKMVGYPDTLPVLNDTRGMQFRILKNGATELTGSSTRGSSGGITSTRGSITCTFSGIYLFTEFDYIEIQVNPIDSGIIHVLAESSCLIELFQLT